MTNAATDTTPCRLCGRTDPALTSAGLARLREKHDLRVQTLSAELMNLQRLREEHADFARANASLALLTAELMEREERLREALNDVLTLCRHSDEMGGRMRAQTVGNIREVVQGALLKGLGGRA